MWNKNTRYRVQASILLVGLSLGSGCTRNYYFGNGDVMCSPMGEPPLIGSGSVCDIPTQVEGGEIVADGSGKTTVISSSPRQQRVIVSQPRGIDDDDTQRVAGRTRGSRDAWQRPDPELATSSQNGFDEDTTIK